MKWYLVKTKPLNEYKVIKNYTRAGIECFNPEYLETNHRGEYVKTPLFKTYLFVNTDLKRNFNILKYARGVSHLVAFGNKQVELDNSVIDSLRKRLDKSGLIRMNFSTRFTKGDSVRIKTGVLKDFEAVFDTEFSDTERVQILLWTLESSKRVKIHPWNLEKV